METHTGKSLAAIGLLGLLYTCASAGEIFYFLELLHILILYILVWSLNNSMNQKGPVCKNKPLCMINNMAFQ